MITNSKNYKKLACVYKIECSVNGFVYIGQTINLFRRVAEHKYKLASGAHRNKQLQADYDKFGENCFSISIISSASPDDLDNIERSAIAYAQSTNKCYNVFGAARVDTQLPKHLENVHQKLIKAKLFLKLRN